MYYVSHVNFTKNGVAESALGPEGGNGVAEPAQGPEGGNTGALCLSCYFHQDAVRLQVQLFQYFNSVYFLILTHLTLQKLNVIFCYYSIMLFILYKELYYVILVTFTVVSAAALAQSL